MVPSSATAKPSCRYSSSSWYATGPSGLAAPVASAAAGGSLRLIGHPSDCFNLDEEVGKREARDAHACAARGWLLEEFHPYTSHLLPVEADVLAGAVVYVERVEFDDVPHVGAGLAQDLPDVL